MARLSKQSIDETLFDDATDEDGKIINVREIINISLSSIKSKLCRD